MRAGLVEAWLDGVRQTMDNQAPTIHHATMAPGWGYNVHRLGVYRSPKHTKPWVVYSDGYLVGTSLSAVGL